MAKNKFERIKIFENFDIKHNMVIVAINNMRRYRIPIRYFWIDLIFYFINIVYKIPVPFTFKRGNGLLRSLDLLVFLVTMTGEYYEPVEGFGILIDKFSDDEITRMDKTLPKGFKNALHKSCSFLAGRMQNEAECMAAMAGIILHDKITNRERALQKLKEYQPQNFKRFGEYSYDAILRLLYGYMD